MARDRLDGAVRRGEPSRPAPAAALRHLSRPVRDVTLRRLTPDESKPAHRKPGLTAVGVSRPLPADILSQGEWSTTAEGKRVWRVAITSTDAEALRVELADFNVGNGTVWILGADTASAGPYTGQGPFGDGQFWTDLVPGEQVIVAYEPSDTASTDLPFRLTQLSHQFSKAKASVTKAAAASCALDVACYPEFSEPASAVAIMIFQSGDGTYQCSGALVNSATDPAVPIFLTANHCISTADEARSLITVFNYQTPTCNGTAPTLSRLPRVTGATLLQTQPMELGDFTLLQLNAFPSVDVKLLGWYAKEIGSAEKVTGISHPVGDYKRIALGQRTRDTAIRFSDGEQMPASKGLQVGWLQGITQGGSSGSPLIAEIDGKPYVVGTLSAGPDVDEDNDRQVCAVRNAIASYGRFAAQYPYLETLLTSKTAVPAVTFTSTPASGNTAKLSWQALSASRVQIRVLSPDGPPMTGFEAATGSAITGDWISEGMVFYLQDASTGDSAGAARTLAQLVIQR